MKSVSYYGQYAINSSKAIKRDNSHQTQFWYSFEKIQNFKKDPKDRIEIVNQRLLHLSCFSSSYVWLDTASRNANRKFCCKSLCETRTGNGRKRETSALPRAKQDQTGYKLRDHVSQYHNAFLQSQDRGLVISWYLCVPPFITRNNY